MNVREKYAKNICLGGFFDHEFKGRIIKIAHTQWKGKIGVISKVAVKTKEDLSLAYTPGVAEPCLAIQKDVNLSYDYTRRWNMVAVVTDGTAVLGLGDIGPEAEPSTPRAPSPTCSTPLPSRSGLRRWNSSGIWLD
jgi:hypothetical protein